MTDNLVALKEIRLEHEEGAPCTAIREGRPLTHSISGGPEVDFRDYTAYSATKLKLTGTKLFYFQ